MSCVTNVWHKMQSKKHSNRFDQCFCWCPGVELSNLHIPCSIWSQVFPMTSKLIYFWYAPLWMVCNVDVRNCATNTHKKLICMIIFIFSSASVYPQHFFYFMITLPIPISPQARPLPVYTHSIEPIILWHERQHRPNHFSTASYYSLTHANCAAIAPVRLPAA